MDLKSCPGKRTAIVWACHMDTPDSLKAARYLKERGASLEGLSTSQLESLEATGGTA